MSIKLSSWAAFQYIIPPAAGLTTYGIKVTEPELLAGFILGLFLGIALQQAVAKSERAGWLLFVSSFISITLGASYLAHDVEMFGIDIPPSVFIGCAGASSTIIVKILAEKLPDMVRSKLESKK